MLLLFNAMARHVGTLLAGGLIARGIIRESDADAVMALAVGLPAVGWSLIQAWQRHQRRRRHRHG